MTKKKYLNKIIIYIFFPIIFVFYKLIYSTYRIHVDKKLFEKLTSSPCILVSFHQRFFPLAGFLGPLGLTVMISQSDDGELAARVVKAMGWKCIIGSTGKPNALKATRSLIKVIKKKRQVALLVDGPLGPASKVKSGVIAIASLTGAPIMPISCGSSRYWQFNSWDRYRIPKPFAKIKLEVLDAVSIPPKLDANLTEECRKDLEQKLIALDEKLDKAFNLND